MDNRAKAAVAVTAMTAVFAAVHPTLAAETGSIKGALLRAAQVRAGNVQPPGHWSTGAMLPRTTDGKMNWDSSHAIPNSGPRALWIGGNGGGN